MAFPVPPYELALHARVLALDPIARPDVFRALMDPLIEALRRDRPSCTEDEVRDSALDAVLAYLDDAQKYDPGKGRLSTYVMNIAKKRAVDRLRARMAASRRDAEYAEVVELRARDPKEALEAEVEAKQAWEIIEKEMPQERDRRVLRHILEGERSTDVLAAALGLTGMPVGEQRRLVKQQRDRVIKFLERLKVRLAYDGT